MTSGQSNFDSVSTPEVAGQINPGVAGQFEPGAALCLSGGGYRAMLFHAGGLLRLNELGWLPRLRHVAGVSGGAILTAWLGLKWRDLAFAGGVAQNLHELLVQPLYDLAGRPLDIAVGLAGFFTPASVLARGLNTQLFRGALLNDLPEASADVPTFGMYSTNLLTGGYAGFTRGMVEEDNLGRHAITGLPLSSAVAASCSIPPTFRPFRLRLDPDGWQGECAPRFAHVRQARTPLRLCDGGNHDNLGLKAVWDRYQTLLVSDGSSPMPPWRWISGDWLATTLRSNRILIDQIRDLKKRELIRRKYAAGSGQDGAYWGISSSADGYGLEDAMVHDSKVTDTLANMRTRLGRHTVSERQLLINFGYAMADTALRRHLPDKEAAAGEWPYPDAALHE